MRGGGCLVGITPLKGESVERCKNIDMADLEVNACQLVKTHEVVKSGSEVASCQADVVLERLFQREVREEQSMSDSILLEEFARNLPIFVRTASPVYDLFRYIYHVGALGEVAQSDESSGTTRQDVPKIAQFPPILRPVKTRGQT